MTFTQNLARMAIFLMLVLLPTFAHSDAATPTVNLNCLPDGTCNGSLQLQGKTRTFHYYMHGGIAADLSTTYHVIFILHDTTSNGASFEEKILGGSFNQMASLLDYLVIYPDAYEKGWNFGPDSRVTDVDDVAFINALMIYFENTHFTKRLKIYAAGMGNGGLMVFRLGCELNPKLNGIAVVAATMPLSLTKTCKLSKPLPVLLFEGRNDPLIPWNKNYMFDFGGIPPIATLTPTETFNFWAALNRLSIPSSFLLVPLVKYDGTLIYKETKKTRNDEVRLYTIYGAGHTWPGGAQYLPENYIGKTSHNLEASPIIANFFYGY